MKIKGACKSLNLQKYFLKKNISSILVTISNYLTMNFKPLTVNNLKVVSFKRMTHL